MIFPRISRFTRKFRLNFSSTSIGLSIDHLKNFVLHALPAGVALCPVVSGSAAIRRHENIFRVVQIRVIAHLDAVDDTRFEVDEQTAGDVVIVVSLVEEDVFAVVSVHRILFEHAILVDAVLGAELFPELHADLVATLANLKRYDLSRHDVNFFLRNYLMNVIMV